MLFGAALLEGVDVDVVSVDVDFVECVVWVVVFVNANLDNWTKVLAFGDPQGACAKCSSQLHIWLPGLSLDKVLLDFGPEGTYPFLLQPDRKRSIWVHTNLPHRVVLRTSPLDLEVP